jgi:hypothetical protein
MMKKNLKHAAAIVLLAGFVVLALGSMGSSPSSSGGGSSSSGCTENNRCFKPLGAKPTVACSRSNCAVNTSPSSFEAGCSCP